MSVCIPVSTGIREGPFLSRPNGRQLVADLCKRRGGKGLFLKVETGNTHEAQASRESETTDRETHDKSLQGILGLLWFIKIERGWGDITGNLTDGLGLCICGS